MSRVMLTTTVDQELKSKVEEKSERQFNDIIEEKFRELIEEQSGEDESAIPFRFDWREFTTQQRKVGLLALDELKEAHTAKEKKDLVKAATSKNFYSSEGYAKGAVDKLVHSDIPIEPVKNPETIDAHTKLRSVEVQCTNHMIDAAALMKNEQFERGECHMCGHVFEGLQK